MDETKKDTEIANNIDNDEKHIIKNNKYLVLGIIFTIVMLIGSSLAIYRYLKTRSAVGITNKEISVTYTEGVNYVIFSDFENILSPRIVTPVQWKDVLWEKV